MRVPFRTPWSPFFGASAVVVRATPFRRATTPVFALEYGSRSRCTVSRFRRSRLLGTYVYTGKEMSPVRWRRFIPFRQRLLLVRSVRSCVIYLNISPFFRSFLSQNVD